MLLGLIVFHVVICVFITIVVLLQFGKGAEAGAMMGGTGGASQNIFSTSSKGNVITKATNVMAILFIVNSLALTKMMTKKETSSIMDNEEAVIQLQNNAPAKTEGNTATEKKSEAVKTEETK